MKDRTPGVRERTGVFVDAVSAPARTGVLKGVDADAVLTAVDADADVDACGGWLGRTGVFFAAAGTRRRRGVRTGVPTDGAGAMRRGVRTGVFNEAGGMRVGVRGARRAAGVACWYCDEDRDEDEEDEDKDAAAGTTPGVVVGLRRGDDGVKERYDEWYMVQ